MKTVLQILSTKSLCIFYCLVSPSQTFLSPSAVQPLGSHSSLCVALFHVALQVRPFLWLRAWGEEASPQLFPAVSSVAPPHLPSLLLTTSLTKDLLFSLAVFRGPASDFPDPLLLVFFLVHQFIFLSLLLIFLSYCYILVLFCYFPPDF